MLEEELKRPLLKFECRHHVYELIPKAIFKKLVGPSKAPTVKLFQDFQNEWGNIDKKKFEVTLVLLLFHMKIFLIYFDLQGFDSESFMSAFASSLRSETIELITTVLSSDIHIL